MTHTSDHTQSLDSSRRQPRSSSGQLAHRLDEKSQYRFYQTNRLRKTVAEWLAGLITGEYERISVIR